MDLRRRTLWAGLLGTVAGAWLVSRLSDGERALTLVRAAGPAALVLVLPYAAATALAAFPWLLLAPRSARPPWAEALRARFSSASVNVIVPGGMAGDTLRLRDVPRESWAAAGEALVWDRVVYLVSTALFLVVGTTLAWRRDLPVVAAGLGASALAALVLATAVGAATRSTRVRAWTRRLTRRLVNAAAPDDVRRTGPASRPLRLRGVALAEALVLHAAARLLLAAEVWVAAWLVGTTLSPGEWLLVSGAMTATAVALPFIPGQAGVQEASLTAALLVTGHSPELGLAVSLLVRARQLLFVPIGLVLLNGPPRAKQTPEPAVKETPEPTATPR